MSPASARAWARSKKDDPVFWSDAIQLVKTTAAAVIAWLLATSVLHLPQSFLAPWSALLVVHATVYRTFSQGLRQVGSAVLGVLLAWAIGNTLGLDATAIAIALFVGLVIGAAPWFEDQATTVAATALVVLTTGFSDNDNMLFFRLLDTGIGIAVGLAVNLVVWPPLRRRTAIATMDALDGAIGMLVVDIATGLAHDPTQEDVEGWLDRTRDLDGDLDHAWALVRQAKESARMNPRRSAGPMRDPQEWYGLLRRMEQAIAETRSMARTLVQSVTDVNAWESRFRDRYVGLLGEVGAAIRDADAPALQAARARIDDFVVDFGRAEMSARLWPEYGGLVTNLRNIVVAMEDVAASNPMGRPPVPFRPDRSQQPPGSP